MFFVPAFVRARFSFLLCSRFLHFQPVPLPFFGWRRISSLSVPEVGLRFAFAESPSGRQPHPYYRFFSSCLYTFDFRGARCVFFLTVLGSRASSPSAPRFPPSFLGRGPNSPPFFFQVARPERHLFSSFGHFLNRELALSPPVSLHLSMISRQLVPPFYRSEPLSVFTRFAVPGRCTICRPLSPFYSTFMPSSLIKSRS